MMNPTRPDDDRASAPELSVVIPSYNSAQWLPSTFVSLSRAARNAGIHLEVLLVDDGSTDDTSGIVSELREDFPGSVELIQQENSGRFLARWAGLSKARAKSTLLLDSRVLIDDEALGFALQAMRQHPERDVWNGHVRTDPSARLVGQFWEVPTHVFWGSYLREPKSTEVTEANFDSVPKGTTMFLAPTELLRAAFESTWPSDDAKLVSDDTKLLRWLVSAHPFRLDPRFSAVYRPRTTIRAFIRHSLDRGTLFVDSYAGTSALRSLIIAALVAAPVVLLAILIALALTGQWAAFALIAGFVLVGALAPVVPAALNRCSSSGILAYVAVLPIFAGPFWLGLVRGTWIHRAAFRSARDTGARPFERKSDP